MRPRGNSPRKQRPIELSAASWAPRRYGFVFFHRPTKEIALMSDAMYSITFHKPENLVRLTAGGILCQPMRRSTYYRRIASRGRRGGQAGSAFLSV